MKQFADRFKVLLLDDVSRLGASMIASGGCYWRNGAGGVSVAHDGFCLDLNQRQSDQIRAVLPIEPARESSRMAQGAISDHLLDLLSMPSVRQIAERGIHLSRRAGPEDASTQAGGHRSWSQLQAVCE